MNKETQQVSSDIKSFCDAIPMSVATFYRFLSDPALAPRTVLVGRSRRVLEKPDEYLARLVQQQTEADPRSQAAAGVRAGESATSQGAS